jgi:hypothetical protein
VYHSSRAGVAASPAAEKDDLVRLGPFDNAADDVCNQILIHGTLA